MFPVYFRIGEKACGKHKKNQHDKQYFKEEMQFCSSYE
jgi:hypothetical protein